MGLQNLGRDWATEYTCIRDRRISIYPSIYEQYEKAKRYDTERWTPRSVGAQYDTEEEQRNSSEKNEEAEPKQKQLPVVDMTGDGSQVQSCKNNTA